MKTKRIIAIIVFCFIFISNTILSASIYNTTTDSYDFELNSDGRDTVTLTKYKGNGAINFLPVEMYEMEFDPVQNKNVIVKTYYPTRVKGDCFSNKESVRESVKILDNYVEIGNGIFKGFLKIKELNIGSGLTTIPEQAFEEGYALSRVIGATNVANIEDRAFYNCMNLSTVSFGPKVEKIGNSAFFNCSRLTSFDFGENIKTIEEDAFFGCVKMEVKKLPSNIQSIEDSAFYGCRRLPEILNIPDSMESIGSEAFKGSNIQYVKIMTADIPTINKDSFDSNVIFVFQEGTKKNGIDVERGYGTFERYEVLFGDANNDKLVNSTDAAAILDMYKNNTPPTEMLDIMKIDLDSNKIINATDAAMVLDMYKNN